MADVDREPGSPQSIPMNADAVRRDSGKSRWATTAIGAFLGLVVFFAIGGGQILNPARVAWLFDTPDPTTHYLGWSFFRHSSWTWPPGLNPDYGMEMGSSVVYSDSIPLLAILCKPFSRWMGEDFQYTGIWLMLCMMLQGVMAMLLMARQTAQRTLQLLGAMFLLIPVVLLKRLEGHYALSGQWLVLWALWLYLEGAHGPQDGVQPAMRKMRWVWAVMAVLAATVHLYLEAMVLAIWLADLVRRWSPGPRKRLATEAAAVLGSTLLAMWAAGYFAIGYGDSRTPGSAGAYSMNLLSLVDARGYSRWLPAIPLEHLGQVEGTCYLGLGLLMLLGVVGLSRIFWRREHTWGNRQWWPLLAVCGLLTLFALSPTLTAGPWKVLDLPNYWGGPGEVLRAAGRMIWPAWYALALLIVGGVVRGFTPRAARWFLAAALVIQVGDLSPTLLRMGDHFAGTPTARALKDPFWAQAGGQYRQVLLVPADGTEDWVPLARFASQHGMAINYGYFAREPWHRRQVANGRRLDEVRSGHLDPQALYVIADESLANAAEQAGAQVRKVEGYWIAVAR